MTTINSNERQLLAGRTFVEWLDLALADIREMLIEKNIAYGNSALDPVRVFSQANAVEQIRVRLDDKISRIVRGADAGEDVPGDLHGYLVLLRIAELMWEADYERARLARQVHLQVPGK